VKELVENITKDTFTKEVLGSELPVIVDFWASWCGPCKMMAPIYEELSKDYEGKMNFMKVNVENEEELAGSQDIMGIPCLIVFNKGKEIDRITGFAPKDGLKQKIDDILEKI
jgi:thioredoxin 1